MKLAVIRVRGRCGVRKDISDTMNMLRIYKGNCCIILEDTPGNRGMLQKAKDYITWGELDADVEKVLMEKRGQEYKEADNGKFLLFGNKKIKPFFRLAPPRGGFERKGIKKQFTQGGVLGYRGKKINDLIKNMV